MRTRPTIENDHGVDGCRPQPDGRWFVQTRNGHFHVRLPAGVRGYELGEDGVLTIETQLGVVELDADGNMTLLACAGAP